MHGGLMTGIFFMTVNILLYQIFSEEQCFPTFTLVPTINFLKPPN